MKNAISLGALVGVALLAVVGCGDDPVTTEPNTFFEPKQGDTFTYARYNRNAANQRDESTKTIHKWAVVETNLSYQGKNNVAKIVQMNFQADGTTSAGANDTLYISTGVDGAIYMNVISATVARIPIAADFASQIPFTWVQVSDVKSANVMKYSAIAGGSVVTDVTLPGVNLPGRVIITDTAYHKGKVGASVNGTNYGNAFHTDHTLKMIATLNATGSRIVDNDSLHLGFDVDVVNGILRQTMNSDTITATIPLQGPRHEAVAGFEMELISSVRK
jgi:hypothetical protein